MPAPTNQQWAQLVAVFPNLVRNDVSIEDNPTPVYNCIAWSIGYNDRWINPQPTEARQTTFYRLFFNNTLPAGDATAEVDAWSLNSNPTHGSVLINGNWESKCGAWYRITHNRNGVHGAVYGNVYQSFS